MKALNQIKTVSRARTANPDNKETSKTTDRANSLTAASRVDSRETKKVVMRTATTRMARTSSSKARHKVTARVKPHVMDY